MCETLHAPRSPYRPPVVISWQEHQSCDTNIIQHGGLKTMDENNVIEVARAHIESLFPKTCSSCGMVFNSHAEYLRNTTHLGDPVSYDAEMDNWMPRKPLGAVVYSNCKCGTTLVLSSKGMKLWTIWQLQLWVRTETWKRGIGMNELLRGIRDEIDRRALSECGND